MTLKCFWRFCASVFASRVFWSSWSSSPVKHKHLRTRLDTLGLGSWCWHRCGAARPSSADVDLCRPGRRPGRRRLRLFGRVFLSSRARFAPSKIQRWSEIMMKVWWKSASQPLMFVFLLRLPWRPPTPPPMYRSRFFCFWRRRIVDSGLFVRFKNFETYQK